MELIGSLATSGPHKLDNAPDTFTRGKSDCFLLATRELGTIGKVRVTLSATAGSAAEAEWHLEAVHLLRKVSADDAAGEPAGSFYHRGWVQPRQVRLNASARLSRDRRATCALPTVPKGGLKVFGTMLSLCCPAGTCSIDCAVKMRAPRRRAHACSAWSFSAVSSQRKRARTP